MRSRIMWQYALFLACLSGSCLAGPLHGIKRNTPAVLREQETAAVVDSPAPVPIAPEFPEMPTTLTLPSNATSIRADITDNFSCDDKVYGYYADVENDCQIFHVCLPVTYADGKENTFRWSFICPEETIFSQDSFTCMRREDMSIECEDSVRYYELNTNFGMAEGQSIAETAEEQINPVEPEEQQAVMTEEQEPEYVATPALAQPKPMKERPAKLPKPNRRKPQTRPQQAQVMSPANKQPSTMPLRKMPNQGSKVTVSKPVEGEAKPLIEAESKPVPPRYKKRPAVTKNSEKENAPPFKVEMAFKASNSDSYKRKRPTFENKETQNAAVVEIVSEPVVVEPVGSEVKLVTNENSVAAPSKEETEKINEPVKQAAEETPIDAVQAIEDAEPQASETGEVFVAPDNAFKTALETAATQLTDAESVEMADKKDEEKQAEEENAKNEELLTVEEMNDKETAAGDKAQAAEEADTSIKAEEAIPTVNAETIEKATAAEPLEAATQPEGNADTTAQFEAQPLAEETADQLISASEPVALGVLPETSAIHENSEEALPALPALEELEEQKPANAVESMPATPEMEQQDPIVEQAFAETDNHMQSVGGFKPVDPELAAEAETLLSDFVSALKSHSPNVTPMLTLPMEEESLAAAVDKEDDAKVELGEPQPEPEEATPTQMDADSLKPAVEEQPLSATMEAENIIAPENESQAEEVAVAEDSPMFKFPISNSFPANMYHIPVKVIQMPYEEESIMQETAKSEEKPEKVEEPQAEVENQAQTDTNSEGEETASDQVANTDEAKLEDVAAPEVLPEAIGSIEDQANAAQGDAVVAQPEISSADELKSEMDQPTVPVAYRPISIDDIVELVKERLDQTPADEKGTPMELVMEPGNIDKPLELKLSTQQKGTAAQEESAEQTPAEDIIFPIYHRLSEAADSEAKAPETIVVDEPSAVVTEIEKLPAESMAVKNYGASSVQKADVADAKPLEVNEDKAELAAADAKTNESSNVKEAESSAAAVIATPDALEQKNTAELAAMTKANRAFRSRSLAKGKLDPRKRRFLFKADAS